MINVDQKSLEAICYHYKLSLVILFGSEAEGASTRGSDIDIAVWSKEKDIRVKYEINLLATMVEFFACDGIEVIILNYADPLLQYEVAFKGRLLYEKQPGEFSNFQLQAMKRNNDAQKFYQLDQIYIKNFLKGIRSDVIQKCHPPQIGKISRVSR